MNDLVLCFYDWSRQWIQNCQTMMLKVPGHTSSMSSWSTWMRMESFIRSPKMASPPQNGKLCSCFNCCQWFQTLFHAIEVFIRLAGCEISGNLVLCLNGVVNEVVKFIFQLRISNRTLLPRCCCGFSLLCLFNLEIWKCQMYSLLRISTGCMGVSAILDKSLLMVIIPWSSYYR